MTVSEHRDLVTALLGVPGVAAAAIDPTADGPGTLRLQLVPGADEVTVAGAVNRLLRSQFGLAVDADRVRVLDEPEYAPAAPSGTGMRDEPVPAHQRSAHAGAAGAPETAAEAAAPWNAGAPGGEAGPATGSPSPNGRTEDVRPEELPQIGVARAGRLVIERVQLVQAGLVTSVSVTLGLDGRTVEGVAEGTATSGSLLRTVAHATLRAVEKVVGDEARFDVDHVELSHTGEDRTALVVLSMVTGRATQRLSGASVVREDVRQAVMRAVLAAVNRRLEPMIGARAGSGA